MVGVTLPIPPYPVESGVPSFVTPTGSPLRGVVSPYPCAGVPPLGPEAACGASGSCWRGGESISGKPGGLLLGRRCWNPSAAAVSSSLVLRVALGVSGVEFWDSPLSLGLKGLLPDPEIAGQAFLALLSSDTLSEKSDAPPSVILHAWSLRLEYTS